MRFLLEQNKLKLFDDNLKEDVWDIDGNYNPSQDSRYKRLLRTPINKLSRDDIKYLFTIHFTRYSDGYNSNGSEHTYWYLGRYKDFDEALNANEYSHGDDFDKTYVHFSKLSFPLKVYRALRDKEDVPSGKSNSLSWTTDINIYKKSNSLFRHCNKIVEAKITADMIQNEYTIVNYVLYSANPSYGRYPESEITLKPRYKTDRLQNLTFINKCDINESVSNTITLYHNTPYKNIDSILRDGLLVNKSRSEEDSSFQATWTSTKPIKGYGDVVLTLEIPVDKFDLEKVNDTEYLLYNNIAPKYITHINYPLDNNHLIMSDNLTYYINKYGKNKVKQILFKNYNKEMGLDTIKNLTKELSW